MNPWRGPTALSRSKADPTAREPGFDKLTRNVLCPANGAA